MYRTVLIIIGLFSFTIPLLHSQNNGNSNDTLHTKNLKELKALYRKTDFKTDSIAKRNYAKVYLAKAKALKSSIHITSGYYYLSKVHSKDRIAYLDSLITFCKENDYSNNYYPTDAYLRKGYLYKKDRKYHLALQNYELI